jgi:hypothetical protein
MVFRETFIAQTDGTVTLLTPTALKNPLTGMNAVIPAGGAVERISIYRDGDATVTSGCGIALGIVGNTGKYIATLDGNTTSQLNNGKVIARNIINDAGISAETELRVTLTGTLSTGSIIFEITYITYA